MNLVAKITIDELIKLRNRSIEIRQTMETLYKEVEDVDKKINSYITSTLLRGNGRISEEKIFIKELDFRFWHYLIKTSGLFKIMTEKRRDTLLHEMHENPEPFDYTHITPMVENINNLYMQNAEVLIQEVYSECIGCRYNSADWQAQSKRDNLKQVKEKFRVSGDIEYNVYCERFDHSSFGNRRYFRYEDLYRAFTMLDNKLTPDYNNNFHAKVIPQLKEGKKEIETEYFSLKCYYNGNQLVTIKRLDLLAMFNQIGSGHTSLPDIMAKRYKKEHRGG